LAKNLWNEYIWQKQTYRELSKKYQKSIPWIRERLKSYHPEQQVLMPRPIVLIVDGFFFGRGIGIMLFRAENLRKNIHWFSIGYETIADYLIGIDYLERNGWQIRAVVCDGRKGVKDALLSRYPLQMCQFHQLAIITRHLTRHPILPASIELRVLSLSLTQTNEVTFREKLDIWHLKWENFLKEKTVNIETKRWFYTHRRLRAAYRSLKTNLLFLFTYQKYPEFNIPNTANSLEGSISHLRDKLRAHRGLKLTQRIKITGELLKGKNPKNLH